VKRVLFIAYHYPPVGGGGVQRSAKFVRYLREFGYEPVVLTGPGPTEWRWTPEDKTLAEEIPADIEVHRVAGPEPPQSGGWRRRAERVLDLQTPFARWWTNGVRALAAELAPSCDVVFGELVPYVTAEAAVDVARSSGKPLVLDLQDPWALDEIWVYPTALQRLRDVRRMRRSLAAADATIMNTPEAAHRVLARFPELQDKLVASIPNGFDREDFQGAPAERRDDAFRIAHTGYLYTEIGLAHRRTARLRRILGGMPTPGVDLLTRSHYFLLQAMQLLIERDPALADVLELHLAGVLSETDRRVAEGCSFVHFHGYMPHAESIALLRGADLLFLPMQDLPAGKRAGLVPGKAYEYLAAERPILAAVPAGDARDILEESGAALICDPADVEGMAAAINQELNRKRAGEPVSRPRSEVLARFERRRLTGELADVLSAVLRGPGDGQAAVSAADIETAGRR
jgi:glycosyltransferase involved in cell wall biosynthesis